MFIRSPPEIIHVNRRPFDPEMISACIYNVRLGGRAARLLTAYARHMQGFTPALKLLSAETGIAPNKISFIRLQLQSRGLIACIDRRIYISWDRIYCYASLLQRLPKGGSYRIYNPIKPSTVGKLSARFVIRKPREIPPQEEAFYKYLESLTMDEYRLLIRLFAGVNKALPERAELNLKELEIEEQKALHPEKFESFVYAKPYNEKPDWIETYELPF